MNPEQGTFLLNDIFLPTLLREHGTTKKVLAAIPEDKGEYSPEPVARTAGDLAWHIASAEMMFMDAVINGKFQIPPAPRPEAIRTPPDILGWYAENFEQRVAVLKALSGEDLVRIVDFRGFMQVPAVTYLNVLVVHSAHHRGQLSTYLRPMGGQVPAIYGESYDSRRAATQAR
jgi:uncharacterized damage-inducible protein DinB